MSSTKRYNNYTLGIFLATLLGISLSLVLFLIGHLTFGELSVWLSNFAAAVFSILFISRIVSGVGYTQMVADTISDENTAYQLLKIIFKPKSELTLLQRTKILFNGLSKRINAQFIGNTIGIVLSVVLTILCAALHAAAALPFVQTFYQVIATGLLFIMTVSALSGLFGRMGRFIDFCLRAKRQQGKRLHSALADKIQYAIFNKVKGFFRHRDINYSLSIVGGLIFGAVFSVIILATVGITSAMTLGGAIPLWLTATVFVLGMVSAGASAAGYIGRCFDFLLGKRTIINAIKDMLGRKNKLSNEAYHLLKPVSQNKAIQQSIRNRINSESIGTVIGVVLGTVAAVILIATGIATLPLFGLGLPKVLAGFAVLAFSISGFGGLGNRLGHAIDKLVGKKSPTGLENLNHSDDPSEEDSLSNQPDPDLSKPKNRQLSTETPIWREQAVISANESSTRDSKNNESANKSNDALLKNSLFKSHSKQKKVEQKNIELTVEKSKKTASNLSLTPCVSYLTTATTNIFMSKKCFSSQANSSISAAEKPRSNIARAA